MAEAQYCEEPARRVEVLAECDVVVCGGGPAGCAAALAAARHGADTILVEKESALGGAPVNQLVAVILSTNGVDFQGVWHEFMAELRRREAVEFAYREKQSQYYGIVDPEQVKHTWDGLLTNAGVRLLHHSYAARAIIEGTTARGLFLETKAGRQAIRARRVIDATGEGIVAAQSGVPWEQGDGEHPYAMALTKMFRMGNVHWPDDFPTDEKMAAIEAALDEEIARGRYTTPVITSKQRLLGYIRSKHHRAPGNRTETMSILSRVLEVDTLDPFQMTEAERTGRHQALEAFDFYRRHVPGFEKAYLLDTSAHIGVRSIRRLKGVATVTADDARELRSYPDGIARSSWDLDVWPATSYTAPAVDRESDAFAKRRELMKRGASFDIRYGCVVADGIDNLFMAGKCISADHIAQSSLRIQQTCMATGQAAGTAAALSIRDGVSPRDVDTRVLTDVLSSDRRAVAPAFDGLSTT